MNGIITQSEIDEDSHCFSSKGDNNWDGWEMIHGPASSAPCRFSKIILAMNTKKDEYELFFGKFGCRGKEWGEGWLAGNSPYDEMLPADISDFTYWRDLEKLTVYTELADSGYRDKELNDFFYLNESFLPHEDGFNFVFSVSLYRWLDINNEQLENLNANGYVELQGVDRRCYSYMYTRTGDLVL